MTIKHNKVLHCGLGLAALALAASAQAHGGHLDHAHAAHDGGLLAGLAHPFTGLDHLLAMLAVGVWASQLWQGRARLGAPALFLAMLLAGALAALGGWVLPQLEVWVAASVAAFGALLLVGGRAPAGLGLLVLAAAAWVHGQAHGLEWVTGTSAGLFIGGFMLGSALLHGLGLLMGSALARLPARLGQGLAMALAASGLLMLLSRL
ncbi:urease accessory protein [Paucibacter oligotrophus]|uniref:Urease accessory protein n=1 Tax=Roseateles oligotrophus TaxID=1769250 RepID=A0A840LAE6_9BURK|nr:HupE/UreJ family protein [Roseateles oligotrophus]MBB4843745.1 urease accessory protein [Roseateles oligotrophus]